MGININWTKSITNGIRDDVTRVANFKPYMWEGSPYYISSYVCPCCNDMMLYKMRARGSNTYFNGKMVDVFNIFTCRVCKKFYASVSTGSYERTAKPLSEYAIVSKSYYSTDDYLDTLNKTLQYANGY